MSLEPCYYGDRKVIYIKISYPDHKNGIKSLTVYGRTFKEVVTAIDKGLTSSFGKVGAKRPAGRPRKPNPNRMRSRTRVF
jgi:hypothetical protein